MFYTGILSVLQTPEARPRGFTAVELVVVSPASLALCSNGAVVKIKVISSKRILGTYFTIKTPQRNENKVLVSLGSVYKEGSLS